MRREGYPGGVKIGIIITCRRSRPGGGTQLTRQKSSKDNVADGIQGDGKFVDLVLRVVAVLGVVKDRIS